MTGELKLRKSRKSLAEEAHLKQLMQMRHESIVANRSGLDVYKGRPINIIRPGDTVYIKERIASGPDDYSPGGIYAERGDMVLVTKILITSEYNGKKSPESTTCTLCYKYGVRHFYADPETGFFVYRNEIMPTDPLVTHEEQQQYMRMYGYDKLEDRKISSKSRCRMKTF